MNNPKFTKTILKILRDLDQYFTSNNIPHVIVGGIMVNIWGRTRNTNDVDVIVDHKKLNITNFSEFLISKGYSTSEYELIEGFKEKSNITIIYKNFRIDLVGLYRKSQITQMKNGIQLKIFDLNLYFDSPETLIANKLFYGSLQDLEDALSVYVRNDLDYKRLEEFCSELGVVKYLKLLEKMSKEDLTEDQIDNLLDELEGLI